MATDHNPAAAGPVARRWRQVQPVAGRAKRAAKQLSLSDALVAAALLHDIGSAPDLAETGILPLDGAPRYLRTVGIDVADREPSGLPLVSSDRS
jgi:hypothetical protein